MSLLDDCREDLELRRLSRSYIDSAIQRIRAFLVWCEAENLDPRQAGRESFLAYLKYLEALGHKTGTLQHDFTALALLYDLLEEREESSSASELKRIRKKYLRSYKPDSEERQIISIEEAACMVTATIDTRDRAIVLLLLKTGIRRGELESLDVPDVDLQAMSVRLKQTRKRTNRTVFFDEEAREALRRWLKAREHRKKLDPEALFLADTGKRLHRKGILDVVTRAAERVGLHKPGAPLDERFGPHCCRHWFSTHLSRRKMPERYIEWLRGDKPHGSIGRYIHIIDPEDVKREYLRCIPQLGI